MNSMITCDVYFLFKSISLNSLLLIGFVSDEDDVDDDEWPPFCCGFLWTLNEVGINGALILGLACLETEYFVNK